MLPRFIGRERSDVPMASGHIQTEGEATRLLTTSVVLSEHGLWKMAPKEATEMYPADRGVGSVS